MSDRFLKVTTIREKKTPLTHAEMDDNFENLKYLESHSNVVRLPASTAIGGHRLVSVFNNEVSYADNRDLQDALVLGLTIHAAEQGQDTYVKTSGLVKHEGWNFTHGKPLFLGVDGYITQEEPTEGFSVVIGEVLSPNLINIKIEPLLELA